VINFKGSGQKMCPVWKVPRQYLLLFLVEVRLREGKALGSEGGTGLEMGFGMSRGKNLSRCFAAYDGNFDINIGRASLDWHFYLIWGGTMRMQTDWLIATSPAFKYTNPSVSLYLCSLHTCLTEIISCAYFWAWSSGKRYVKPEFVNGKGKAVPVTGSEGP
jgi:hypothetical protein